MMHTFTLLLFLGFVPPVQIDGYRSLSECEMAGADAVSKCSASKNCRSHCIIGPTQ
jgi:hypothetical protein